MKSLEELAAIKQRALKKVYLREESNDFRVVVGMGTCGIAAGARPVYDALVAAVKDKKLTNVTVSQVGCMGECALEPIVEVYDKTGRRSTYCKVKESDVSKIVDGHLVGGEPVKELLRENYR